MSFTLLEAHGVFWCLCIESMQRTKVGSTVPLYFLKMSNSRMYWSSAVIFEVRQHSLSESVS